MENISEIQRAFQIANGANLSREELETLEKQEIFMYDQKGSIIRAQREARLEIAGKLLDILGDETISQTTGLTVEEIQKLR